MVNKITKVQSARIQEIEKKALKGRANLSQLRYGKLLKKRKDAYFHTLHDEQDKYFRSIETEDMLSCAPQQPAESIGNH